MSANRAIITLVGMGGSGKSRLASEAVKQLARHQIGRFLDGIYFINLINVTDSESFTNNLSATFDLKTVWRPFRTCPTL